MKLPKNALVVLFASTAFLGAGLLFLSELMVAKLLLPLFGGSPGVWNTCMVFFQAVLLLGYVYAHLSIKKAGLKWQPMVHGGLVLLPLLVLPLTLPAWAGSNVSELPVWNIIATLAVTIGAPFFILSTAGPLLQAWFAATPDPRAKQPYFLYAAGNFGSFIALLAYPFVVEPLLSLKQQTIWWAVGYGLFIAMVLACVAVLFKSRSQLAVQQKVPQRIARITWRQKIYWLLLAALPSSLMLGVTTYITTDVAAMPLLWMVPLALYLLTFVFAFGTNKPAQLIRKTAPFAAAMLVGAIVITAFPSGLPLPIVAGYYFLLVALISLVAHTRLAATKPNPVHLTEFYLWLAIGGVLGGTFNSLLAPIIFNDLYEFPLVLLAAVPVLVGRIRIRKPTRREMVLMLTPAFLAGVVLIISIESINGVSTALVSIMLGTMLAAMYLLYRWRPALLAVGMVPVLLVPIVLLANQGSALYERTFYGVIKIEEGSDARVLQHGFTQHGAQLKSGEKAQEPTTYYHREGPLGDIVAACRKVSECKSVGGLGLGVGTVAAYGREGDSITFYEIDPAIVRIATNPNYFTYLSASKAKVNTIIGDGRLTLGKDSNKYDLLIIDAFSSDAIPMHLLTREAFAAYKAKLHENGLIAMHISNRNLNLEQVVRAAARDAGMPALIRFDEGNRMIDRTHYPSKWVVLATKDEGLAPLQGQPNWADLRGADIRTWTDDYSNLLDAF
jgi:hypothetical protein